MTITRLEKSRNSILALWTLISPSILSSKFKKQMACLTLPALTVTLKTKLKTSGIKKLQEFGATRWCKNRHWWKISVNAKLIFENQRSVLQKKDSWNYFLWKQAYALLKSVTFKSGTNYITSFTTKLTDAKPQYNSL